jgi:hypothetical protein
VDGLLEIVDAEGPLTTERLFQVYLHAAGGKRVGKAIRKTLLKHVGRLCRMGEITCQHEAYTPKSQIMVVRRPAQAEVIVRTLGDRALWDVPPKELAELMSRIIPLFNLGSVEDQQELYRTVLEFYGMKRLSRKIFEYLHFIHNTQIRS